MTATPDLQALSEALLNDRPTRSPRLQAENDALRSLIERLADSSETILTTLCDIVLANCNAGSAGVSLLETDETFGSIFRWPAIAGAWAPFIGGHLPRNASPCGVVIDQQATLLFQEPQQFFPDIAGVEPPIVEALLAPFFSRGEAIGTVWALSHDPALRFDREDRRFLDGMARFASLAYQTVRAEESKRDVQQRLNQTLSNAEIIGLWDWHIVEDRVFADARFATMFSVDPARAALGAPISEFLAGIHPQDRDRVWASIQQAIRTGEPLASEYRLQSATGEVRHIVARGQPERSADGTPLRFPGAAIDVTPLRRAEDALHASEAQFHRLAQAMPNHVWTTSADGQLDWLNAQCYTYSGLEPGALSGDSWAAIVHPDDLPNAVARWSHAVRTGEAYEAEFRLRRADEAYRWHIARALPLDWQPGGSRWVGTNTDIEDHKTTAAALAALNEELEERVAARTAELMAAEESVRQLQKMEAVGQLTGGIAHDFNNLLTGIIGSIDLIRRRIATGRSDDTDRFLTAATTSAQRAASLTHRLLAFARRQSLDTKPQDVNALVNGMADLLHRTLGETIKLETRIDPALWPAMADANQFENALLNLVINARDAMPDGGTLAIAASNVHLDAHAARLGTLSAGDYVVVAVSDTGVGMAPSIVERAFDPFFTTKPIGLGTGLGLSMIYGFAQQSEGHVRIDSEVDKGTTIRLYLRRAENVVPESTVLVPGRVPDGDGETVLVVEDDAAVRLVIGEVLDELGYLKVQAADASAAIPVLESGQAIDLLITDVGLPGINGRQLAEIARAKRPGLKVLFVTGYAEKATLRAGFLEPGMELMTKPFALDALAAKVRELLRHATP